MLPEAKAEWLLRNNIHVYAVIIMCNARVCGYAGCGYKKVQSSAAYLFGMTEKKHKDVALYSFYIYSERTQVS